MTRNDVLETIEAIELGVPDLSVDFHENALGQFSIRIKSSALPYHLAHGRWWEIDRIGTRSDVVRTVFMALQTWTEHELREGFKYRGVSVLNPHPDYDELLDQIDDEAEEDRRYTEHLALYG